MTHRPTLAQKAEEHSSGQIKIPRSYLEFVQFAMRPQNWVVMALLFVAAFGLLRMFWYEFVCRHMVFKFGFMFVTCVILLCGLLGGTYYTYLCKQLEEAIECFKQLNESLKEKIDTLKEINNDLKETAEKQRIISENLQTQLDGFSELKEQMTKFANDQNEDFNEVFNKAMGVFEGMKKQVHLQAKNNMDQKKLNIKNAAMVAEMNDMEFGMNRQEYSSFYGSIAEDVKRTGKDASFETLAQKSIQYWESAGTPDNKGLVHRTVIFALIDEITQVEEDELMKRAHCRTSS